MIVRLPRGVSAALAAAALFGASTPLAKVLLEGADPRLLAGLLYLGAGLGLALLRAAHRSPRVGLPRAEAGWLAGAVLAGGVLAPVLLLTGLARLPASGASLLLNAEVVLTAVIAWVAFRENVDARVALGLVAITAGALVLSWPDGPATVGDPWPSLMVLGACLLWATDNNLTRQVSTVDATWVAMVKGLVAGSVNLALGLGSGAPWPTVGVVASALVVGFAAYGASLALFVVALRELGTARTGAYFSVAPFVGAGLAVALGDDLSVRLGLAGVLMAAGVWLHLSERHAHEHTHPRLTHDHWHTHDDGHHEHDHRTQVAGRHRHPHLHEPATHSHLHHPDVHHRHTH